MRAAVPANVPANVRSRVLAAALAAASLVAPAADARADLAVGDEVPDFTLKDQDGKDVTLSSFRGKKSVVVGFYPKDFSPGCTTQMKCVTREWKKIEDRGAVVLAISGDPVAKHKEFAVALGVRFPLLSDPDFAVSKKYGVFTPSTDGGYAARSVFVVDREGKLRWMERDFAAPRTLEGTRLLQELDALRPAGDDPAAGLDTLSSPEREAKTLLVRWVQAFLREDVPGMEALLHPDFGARPGETAAMAKQRRTTELDRVRKLHDQLDLKSVKFDDAIDLRDAKVVAKGDHAKPGALGGFTDVARKAASDLADGDLLVVARTKNPKLADTEVLPREVCLTLRKSADAWRVLSTAGR